jgi:NAD(P)-dependent dehydrogenase (short-subunit alcohol dehydrogenase family)
MTLSGKNIVVTGAASGIGAETARVLKAAGASVIGLDRHETKENVDQFISVDLSDPNSIAQAAEALPDGIDALCNIAGLPPTAGVVPVMKVNLLGLQALTELVLQKMSDGGSIVNVASLAGSGWPGATEQVKAFQEQANFDNVESVCAELGVDDARGYFFSKEVLIVWTMQNRWTWRDRGIRMNCVSPGPVETPILADFLKTLGERAEEDMRIMDRAGRSEDIAPVIAFLCSEESAWIRGANIPTDGGMYSHMQCEMNGLN